MPFERFERPARGSRPATAASATLTRYGTLVLNKAAMALLDDDTQHVQLLVDADDQAIAIMPSVEKNGTYKLTRRESSGGQIALRLLARDHAVAAGKYRIEQQKVLGKDALAFHFVRFDVTANKGREVVAEPVDTRTPWQQAYDGLLKIALNPRETKRRRALARRALAEAGRPSPQPSCHTIEPISGPVGNHSGNAAIHTHLVYEGGGD